MGGAGCSLLDLGAPTSGPVMAMSLSPRLAMPARSVSARRTTGLPSDLLNPAVVEPGSGQGSPPASTEARTTSDWPLSGASTQSEQRAANAALE